MRRRSWNVTLRSAGSFAPDIHIYTMGALSFRFSILFPVPRSVSLGGFFFLLFVPGSKHASKIRINAPGAATGRAVYAPRKSNDKLIARHRKALLTRAPRAIRRWNGNARSLWDTARLIENTFNAVSVRRKWRRMNNIFDSTNRKYYQKCIFWLIYLLFIHLKLTLILFFSFSKFI